ncbi:sugar O-acetyltransferase [Bacillus sp. CGMCC 1.16541]|uniref:sugar O-acetyltransferase n=1 Tax=Bacillus sp. CGMCC 1.16541 TaxID=2185143 RepID=UPI000D73A52C|nr:sugar O-acetyltransferase [Bacillus sp. CGMCC 1.16541]
MTEKEKMLNGENYNTRDAEISAMNQKARKLLHTLNVTSSGDPTDILKELLGEMGEGVWIERPFFCDYGENISIGKDTFINFNCTFLDCNKITIGQSVLIGPGTQIYTATHPLNPKERIISSPKKGEAPYLTSAIPVSIGDNVWIGGNVSIMPGVTIGDGSVIGAGSVVTKSIPSGVVAVGNPCRVVKRVDEE